MADLLTVLLEGVREAGKSVLALQNQLQVTTKSNYDIVTQADLAANDILREHLSCFPDIGWLSEESADDERRLKQDKVWIVDPIDGTREYAKGIPEFAISIALIERGQPIISVVFNPATNELFHAVKHQGAWLNGARLACLSSTPERLVLLASRSEYNRGEWEAFHAHDVQVIGSIAYKLALIAAGRAHATFSLGPKSEWDIAGGVLLVSEAGGTVTDKCREGLLFNQKNVKVNGIVATAAHLNETIFSLISKNHKK